MTRSLFLPGAVASAAFWHGVGARIQFPVDPHYFSWPGLGIEPPDPAINSVGDLVSLVLRQIDGPSHLIAQSMGGLVAIKAALRASPGQVQKLVLTATSAGLPMESLGASDWREVYLASYPNAGTWIADPQEDLTHDLHFLTLPTLLIWGDADPISPVSVGERLQELMPDASLYIVSGGSHDLAATHAEEIAPVIADHLGYAMTAGTHI